MGIETDIELKEKFKIVYNTENINEIVEDLLKRKKESNNSALSIKISTIIETVFNEKYVKIESISSDDTGFSPEEKRDILNIMKKNFYFLPKEEEYVYEDIKNIKEVEKNSQGLVLKQFVNEILYYFAHEMIGGFDIDYIIYNMTMYENKIPNISKFGTDRIYMIKHKEIQNNKQTKLFLRKTSEELDTLAYKSMYKEMVADRFFKTLKNSKSIYSLDELYTKTLNKTTDELMIDYGIRFAYENSEKFERIINSYEDNIVLSSLSIKGNNYGIEDTELKVLLSILAHKNKIVKEIDTYHIIYRIIKYTQNNYKPINKSPKRKSFRRSKENIDKTIETIDQDYMSIYNEIKNRKIQLREQGIELTAKLGNLIQLNEQNNDNKSTNNIRMLTYYIKLIWMEINNYELYSKAMEQFKSDKKMINNLHKLQKTYIEKKLEDKIVAINNTKSIDNEKDISSMDDIILNNFEIITTNDLNNLIDIPEIFKKKKDMANVCGALLLILLSIFVLNHKTINI